MRGLSGARRKILDMTFQAPIIAAASDRLIVPLSEPEAIHADRVGPKAANLAALSRAGLPTPGGFCLTAHAYRLQLCALGLDDLVLQMPPEDSPAARRIAVQVRLALYQRPIAPAILGPLLDAWRAQHREHGPLGVVRSSALVEDCRGASFAGQFESFLGLDNETDLVTAVRACWAALW